MNSFQLSKVILKGRSALKSAPRGRFLITLFIAMLFLAIALAEYFGFVSFFRELDGFSDIKPIIVSYSLYSLFTLLFAVIFASVLLSGPFIYLNRKSNNLLLPLPIKDLVLFNAHFIEQIFLSLWIALVFGIPAILSLLSLKMSIILLGEGLFFFLILVILAVIGGNICLLIIMTFTRRLGRWLNFLIISLLLVALGYLLAQKLVPHEIFELLASNNANGNSEALTNLRLHFNNWPSGWFTNTLLSDLTIIASAIMNRVCLLLVTAFAFILQSLLAWKVYRRIVIASQEEAIRPIRQKSNLLRFHDSWLLIAKEWFLIIRSRRDLGQLIFFLFMLAIYLNFIFSSKAISITLDPLWTPRIIIFIIITLCYFITLMALRFVFPLTSIERNESWFFLTLPRLRENNFTSRLFAWFIPMFLLIELMVLLTGIGFSLKGSFILPLLILLPFITLFILTLANVLGTVFPVREKNNPEELSTTVQGLSLLVLISAYVLICSWLLGFEIREKVAFGTIGINMGWYFWLVIFISLMVTILLWKKGHDKYQQKYLS